MPVFLLPEDEIGFPDPQLAEEDGLLAVGGDLSPMSLLTAYSLGVFPWFNEGDPILWWSLNPRLLCFPDEAKFSKSLLGRIRRKEYQIKIDTSFREVITCCASTYRPDQIGKTWITNDVIDAYCKLHELGYAHSFETYKDNKLVGGLYGLSIGSMFSGESMFHLATDASKVAFYHLVQVAKLLEFDFIDCQQVTEHLQTMGAEPVPRIDFLKLLDKSIQNETIRGSWKDLVRF
jgi:leucyl/phenylalanyl-tRNA--protein transferase